MSKTWYRIERTLGQLQTVTKNLIVAVGCVLLLLIIFILRLETGAEVKVGDLALPALVFGFYLLLTDQITRIGAGGVTIERAFAQAAEALVESQVDDMVPLPIVEVEVGTKGGPAALDRMIQQRTAALSFRFGHGGYYGPAIENYLTELRRRGAIRWIIFENPDGTFWGLAQADEMGLLIADQLPPKTFAESLNENNSHPIESASTTLILADTAVEATTEKRKALTIMEENSVNVLPVLDERRSFIGVVERDRLLASILLDIDRQLRN